MWLTLTPAEPADLGSSLGPLDPVGDAWVAWPDPHTCAIGTPCAPLATSALALALDAAAPSATDQALPWIVRLPAVPGAQLRELLEPLGYRVTTVELGAGVVEAELRHHLPARRLLDHLCVVLTALDPAPAPGAAAVLADRGAGWLDDHPLRASIRAPRLTDPDAAGDAAEAAIESQLDGPIPLGELRVRFAVDAAVGRGAVLDLGCGGGRLTKRLAGDGRIARLGAVDVSAAALARAAVAVGPRPTRVPIEWIRGSAVYRDERLRGWDVVIASERVEHLEPHHLPAFADGVFGFAAPARVVLTTPNAEVNDALGVRSRRHPDHRFEWDREAFVRWTDAVAQRYGYDVARSGIGAALDGLGSPTQAAVFDRRAR